MGYTPETASARTIAEATLDHLLCDGPARFQDDPTVDVTQVLTTQYLLVKQAGRDTIVYCFRMPPLPQVSFYQRVFDCNRESFLEDFDIALQDSDVQQLFPFGTATVGFFFHSPFRARSITHHDKWFLLCIGNRHVSS